MPELPLLRLPNAVRAGLPDGGRNISHIRKPAKGRQQDRFGPVFDRLQAVLARPNDPIELREDPTALAPERVIVFEIAGTVANFLKALRNVRGLEFMAELDTDFASDEDFAVQYGDAERSWSPQGCGPAVPRVADAEPAAAPGVFLINLSMGDVRRPFAGVMSPLARLLDYLADRYGLLFMVSGGNILHPLAIDGYTGWMAFETATPENREKAIIRSLNNMKHERTILSPGEALNVLTIGARHHDNVAVRQGGINMIDPIEDDTLPNITSGLGLGYRRMIKPELYLSGGREHVRMQAAGDELTVVHSQPRRTYGLSAAAPDALNQGRLDQVALTAGTSPATALATRAGAQIFEALMDADGGSVLADIDPQYYAVVVKALIVHCSEWSDNVDMLKEICGPADRRRHVERADNAARFIGYGIPKIDRVLECTPNRATLVGYGTLQTDSAQSYRIPLPQSLAGITDPRFLSVTLAWTSPIKPGHQSYRSVKLEAAPDTPFEVLGVQRRKKQPSDPSCKRGSIFHEHFEGDSAVAFLEDGTLALRIWCKEDSGSGEHLQIRYGVAVTIESGTALPIYQEIQEQLRIRPRP